jgi:HSP20 family protein
MTLMRHRTAWPAMPTWPDERIDRIFREMLRDFFTGGAMLDRMFEDTAHQMHLEEFVEDGTCVIRAELPGVDPDKDIDITVANGMVHLQAQREERKEEDRPGEYRSEFRYGRFARSVRLPEGVTEADVKASYKDGILEVRIPAPTTETPTPTKVPIDR